MGHRNASRRVIDTQIFDWDSEPAIDRGSTQFHEDSPSLPHRRAHARGTRVHWLLALGVAIAGSVALLLIPRLHQHLHALV